jgi:hypothetical protein
MQPHQAVSGEKGLKRGFFRQTGEVQVAEFAAWRHEFDNFLDNEHVAVQFDGFTNCGLLLEVQDGTWMAAIGYHNTDFIHWHTATPG